MPKARAIFHTDEREYSAEQIAELDAAGLLAKGDGDQPLPPGGMGLGLTAAVHEQPAKAAKPAAAAVPAVPAKEASK